jgi:hypothetical protein
MQRAGQTFLSVPPLVDSRRALISLRCYVISLLQPLLCRAHGPALLETFPAEDRAPLRGPEGNCRFLPALRTVCFRFRSHRSRMPAATPAFGSLCFAGFTSFGLVFEAFVGEKHLFAAGEHELRTALRTLQHLVVVFHEPLSPWSRLGGRLGKLCTGEPTFLRIPVSGDAGRGSLGPSGTKLKHDPKTSLPYGGLILGSAAQSRDVNG